MTNRIRSHLMTAIPALLLIGLPGRARAQGIVRGTVTTAENGAPIRGAAVTAVLARRAAVTDRFGRFHLRLNRFPDTVRVGFIGRAPAVLVVESATDTPLTLRLARSPIQLPELTVTPSGEGDITTLAEWHVTPEEVRAVPPAVEADVFRSLTLVPAVSFSTPLSARPIVRGYSADESLVRIDGHEVLNVYHIGRIFSAFPADATQQLAVQAGPPPASEGGTLAGIIDIDGRVGGAKTDGGVGLSLASLSGWMGGEVVGAKAFGAVRLVYASVLELASEVEIPYNFQDFYGSVVLGSEQRPRGRITLFVSRDHLLDRDIGTGMDWSNLLLGTRYRLRDGDRWSLSLSGAATRFAEDVEDVRARRADIDLRNRFTRIGSTMELVHHGRNARVTIGVSAGLRSIRNRIIPEHDVDFAATDTDLRRMELAAYAEWSQAISSLTLELGARIDAAGSLSVIQPRLRVRLPLTRDLTLGAGVGRTARLYHLISDQQAEPDLAFYDFWLASGQPGVAVPRVDHAAVDLDYRLGRLAGRLSLFASRAAGLMELRPLCDTAAAPDRSFRTGRGGTLGFEAQTGFRLDAAGTGSVTFSYVYSRSQRNWGKGGGWVDWTLDRRHVARVFAQRQFGQHWALFSAFEGATGPPFTPVEEVILIETPSGIPSPVPQRFLSYVYGAEGSARSGGTARLDFGGTYEFGGPWNSRMAVGLSVLNVAWGPVAPVKVGSPESADVLGPRRVSYERLFGLPAVPTITFRARF